MYKGWSLSAEGEENLYLSQERQKKKAESTGEGDYSRRAGTYIHPMGHTRANALQPSLEGLQEGNWSSLGNFWSSFLAAQVQISFTGFVTLFFSGSATLGKAVLPL